MIAEEIGRIPPHDIKAEVCVLGSMLLDVKAVSIAREIVDADSFYRPAHQHIYKAIAYMADHPARWGSPDVVTLRAAMAERGCLEKVGGVEYLVELLNVPQPENVGYYARIVADNARKRQLIIASTHAVDAGFGQGEASEVISEAMSAISHITIGTNRRSTTSADDVGAALEDAIAGRRQSISWPWQSVTRWAKACAPGAVTIICGEPGSGKSFLLQEAMLHWHRQGIRTSMIHLEKDRRYHQTRALGQLAQNNQILSDEWQMENPVEAREILEEYRETLDSYGETVWDDPDGSMTIDAVQQWLTARISDGSRIVGVDPITAADSGGKPWEVDRRFIVSCQAMAARAGSSIVLVTHPRSAGNTAPNVDALAGGRAYGRLSDCVMWLQGHNPPIDGEVRVPMGVNVATYNRTLTLCKTRDGTGQGLSFALEFAPGTLHTTEIGIISKDK